MKIDNATWRELVREGQRVGVFVNSSDLKSKLDALRDLEPAARQRVVDAAAAVKVARAATAKAIGEFWEASQND